VTNPVAKYLQQQGFLILDGALATELEKHGADLDDPLWSARCVIEAPELITRVHQDYLQAGADVIISATYQASVAGFQARGINQKESVQLIKKSVLLAMDARDNFWSQEINRAGRLKPLVATSIGPYGACMHDGSEYHGNYSVSWKEVEEFHRSRLDVLTDSAADLLAMETIPSMAEAEILLSLLGEYPDQAAWISFSCKNEQQVSHGELFSQCAELASRHEQVVATGINCTAPELIGDLLRSAGEIECPLLVYPNSGETWLASENSWSGDCETQMDPVAWFSAGAKLMGGCCRTSPEDIAQIRASLLGINE
jgi:homocysteine S-methyltransferase